MDGSLRESSNDPFEGRRCRSRFRGRVTAEEMAEAWFRLTPVERRRFRRLTDTSESTGERIARLQVEADELLASTGGAVSWTASESDSERLARLHAEIDKLLAEFGLNDRDRR